MRVLLVNPPASSENAVLPFVPEAVRPFLHRLVGPPLGLLAVARALRTHEVSVLDMKAVYDLEPNAPPPGELLADWLHTHQPRVLGITFVASEFPIGIELFRAAKALDPSIVTVAGGLHAALCPSHFLLPCVDAVCPGMSPAPMRGLVDAVEHNTPLHQVAGLLLPTAECMTATPPAPPFAPQTEGFPVPDRAPLRRWLPAYVVGRSPGPCTYLYTSLGCPHRCRFCSIWPQLGGRHFQRSASDILAELRTLDDYPVVRFADANSAVRPDILEELFDRIHAEGLRKFFVMDIRADTVVARPDLVARLARGGLKVVIMGIESPRPEELASYNKRLRPEDAGEAIRILHDHGVLVRATYIVAPHYAAPDFQALADFAGQHNSALAAFTLLTPFPGTALHSELSDAIIDHNLARYNLFNCVLRTRLPIESFYEHVGRLWLQRAPSDVL